MKFDESNKSIVPFGLNGSIEYVSNSIISKTIVKKLTGTVHVYAFDSGQEFVERISAFDSFIQILDGTARITVDSSVVNVDVGQAMIIPAHSRNTIVANTRFKMLSTVIKSGYEDESVL